MDKIYLLITIILTFVISIVSGSIAYRLDTKKNYSFLGNFPFELESKKNGIITIVFRIILGVSIVVSCIGALSILVFDEYSIFISKALGYLLVFTSLFMMSLFIISFKSLKNHLISSSIFSVSVLMSYILFVYYTFRDDFNLYHMSISIIGILCALIILIIMFIPSLSSWYKKKKITLENGEEELVRGKFNILALLEWITIFLYMFLYILLFVGRII